jgi:hypothetical protein
MDMKRILQAMDGVATKPVVGANDMARFLRVVSEADLNQMPDPRQDTQADGTPTYTPDELADIQHPNAAEWVAVRNQIQDAKAKGIDPAEIAKLQARYDQLAGGNAERWEQTYAKNQAVKAADQAAGYNNNVQYVNPTEEDISFNGATQHDNGDMSYQAGPLSMRKNKDGSSDTTATIGDTTARVQQNPIGVKTITAQGPAADVVNSVDASTDRKGVNPAKFAAFQKQLPANESMDKFLSIVKKNDVSILNEGSPHKVSLPVQMAMQHYQKEDNCQQERPARVGRESVVRKYFDQAEQAVQEQQVKKQNFYKQYAQTIAERVLMKESRLDEVNPIDIAKGAANIVKSNPKGSATVVGGGAIHAANGNIDDQGQDAGWWEKRIHPDIPYTPMEVAFDLGIVGAGALAGAMGGPIGLGAEVVANLSRIKKICRIIEKVVTFFGANVARSGAQLVGPIREWVKTLAGVGITTAAFHTLNDLIKDALRALPEDNLSHAHLHNGPGAQSNAPDGGHLSLSELSTDTLGKYKKAAYADAKKADAEGDYARGDKRFKGINKATIKQFDNDLKKHNQNPIKEANAKKRTLKNSNPCWDGYKPVGTKKKGGRTVPNCVPKE